MSGVYRGAITNGQLVRTQRPHLTIDENSLQTLEEAFECRDDLLFDFLPAIDSPHPDFPQLVCKGLRPEFLHLKKARFSATYRGIVFTGTNLPADKWSIQNVAGAEPIDTHPDFDTFGTTANDAVFQDGVFINFGRLAPDALRGVTSFLTPSVVVSVVRYSIGAPSGGSNVGKINNPGGPLAGPNSSGSQNWLKVGFSAEDFGEVWQARESWLRSGDKGWNTTIYN